jgi:TolB-like protein/Tfp pilus assembly protein PilF
VLLAVIAMSLVALPLAIYYSSRPEQPQPGKPINSIAVLPFKPLIAESRDEALELGMADTLINKLSNIRQVTVRPLSAVRKYTDLEQDAAAAGREQKVDAVLDGNIQKSGEKMRVTVRLVRVADGREIWSEQFDEKFTDIFSVQDSVSRRVSGMLAVTLTGEERALVTKHYTNNADAYQLYLKGRYFWNKRTGEAIRKGIDYFSQAIEKDQNYAPAHAGLAQSYVLLAGYGESTPQEAYSKARASATKAIKIDDQLTDAHAALAYVKTGYDWDFAGAEREYKRAIELNPNDATARHWYAEYLALMGHPTEAIAEMRRAQELEPLSLIINKELGTALYLARQFDQAIEQLRKTLELDSSFVRAHIQLGSAYGQKEQHEEAISEFRKAIGIDGKDPHALSQLAYTYAVSARRNEANKIIEQLKERSKRRQVSSVDIAIVCAGLGEKSQAFEQLEKAYSERDEGLLYLKTDPVWDSLRSDPRFSDLLRRVGFSAIS